MNRLIGWAAMGVLLTAGNTDLPKDVEQWLALLLLLINAYLQWRRSRQDGGS